MQRACAPPAPPGVRRGSRVRRAVIYTNVLVPGLLRPDGPPGRMVDLLLAGALWIILALRF